MYRITWFKKSTKQTWKEPQGKWTSLPDDRKFYYFSFRNRSSREKLVKI